MKRNLFFPLLFAFSIIHFSVFAADVPYTIDFAGMKLRISEQGRKRIQEDLDLLRKNDKYFQLKLERVDMYFPVIEKVLEEEGLPDDFKYLAVQESSLISDAVSTSNAVGYWQFKKESALEVGLVIDSEVDERKHIISATRGAARYLKRNNFFLKNWVFSLLSYNVGLGGAKSMINQRDIGAERMDIDMRTHWYIIKFLAHKLAFQDVIGKHTQPSLTLLQYKDVRGKTLNDIARHMEVPLENLENYNKWLNKKRIPEDRDYIIIVPAPTHKAEVLLARMNSPQTMPEEKPEYVEPIFASSDLNAAYPVLEKKQNRTRNNKKAIFYSINGKPGIQAQPGDNSVKLAETGGISYEKFVKYNDLKANEALIPGEVYYLRKKRKKAKVDEHIVTEGETMWQISQKYGVSLQALLRKNRMKRPEKLKHGRVIWLRSIRPAKEPVEIRSIPKPPTAIAANTDTKKNTQADTQPLKTPVSKPAEEKKQISAPSATNKPPVKSTEQKPVVKPAEEKKVPAKPAEEKQPVVKMAEEKKPDEKVIEEAPIFAEKPESVATLPSKPEIITQPKTEVPQPEEIISDSGAQKPLVESIETKEPEQKTVKAEQPAGTTPAEVSAKTHTVTTGQTLYAIGKLYTVTIAQLREWNNLQPSDGLKIGQILVVSEQEVVAEKEASLEENTEEFIEYTVRKGDSLYKIAKDHSVAVKDLAEWNNKDNYGVAIGERLKIKQNK